MGIVNLFSKRQKVLRNEVPPRTREGREERGVEAWSCLLGRRQLHIDVNQVHMVRQAG